MKNLKLKTQKSRILHKVSFVFVCIFVCGMSSSRGFFSNAHAATISFDPQETTVGTSTSFLIGVTLDSEVPVNTIHAVIDIPESMEVLDASDGNSIINFWIDRPTLASGGRLTFSGIIPGGFIGYRGKLLTLTVQAHALGKQEIILDPTSRVYLNTPSASADAIMSIPLELSVVAGRENIKNDIPDTDAPEPFEITRAQLPGDLIPGELAWSALFQAVDKRSGIDHYEVAESGKKVKLDDERGIENLSWQQSESPYVLTDQHLHSYIYVKAVDARGNIRVEMLAPVGLRTWSEYASQYIIELLVVIGILLLVIRLRKHVSIRK
jgi:hypothetical protein